ncbi:MAG: LysM peptidoglycan-binding domain-containing protein, partial [Saprospiraceae bacterium]|nr:LysM peptidoglycan-binding domain-containing protein [Saprospiraceae bacterium]
MMRKRNSIRFMMLMTIFGAFSGRLYSTGDSLQYLLPHDTLFLDISMGEMIATHTVAQGQTLFSLAQFYGLKVPEIKFYNPGMGNQIKPDQLIRLPVPTKSIIRIQPDTFHRWAFSPLFYRIKSGDTLYGLSKRFFKLPVDTIINRIESFTGTLRPGQLFFVGWISTKGVPRSLRESLVHPLFRQNYALEKHIRSYVAQGKKKRQVSGAALWEEGKDDRHFYALHNEAPLDSYVRIYNPMKKRYIFAKVIGRLPRSTPPNVQIYLTSKCAKLMGAREPHFFVE